MLLLASNCRRFAQASDRAATQRAGPFNRSSAPGFGNLPEVSNWVFSGFGNLLEGSWTGFLFSFLFLFLFLLLFFFVFQVYVFSFKKMFALLQKCWEFENNSCFQILFTNSKTVCISQKLFKKCSRFQICLVFSNLFSVRKFVLNIQKMSVL